MFNSTQVIIKSIQTHPTRLRIRDYNIPFHIIFSDNGEWNDKSPEEMWALVELLLKYYDVDSQFRNILKTKYDCVMITKTFHEKDDEFLPHFNIRLTNYERSRIDQSQTFHVYTKNDLTEILSMSIKNKQLVFY